MSNIKLFRLNEETWDELKCTNYPKEKEMQELIESNMKTFLGINFLKSEYFTGKAHDGYIDSLGIDENYRPVIIEYKRSRGANVISQVLSYYYWLMDHKAEFKDLVSEERSKKDADRIKWLPRLLCVARDFTKHDEDAVKAINKNKANLM